MYWMVEAGGGGGFMDLKDIIIRRMRDLADEKKLVNQNGKVEAFVMPVGLFLVIDKENGGDITAQELIYRFDLLNVESSRIIDFYFLGWEWTYENLQKKGIKFNLKSFNDCRNNLKKLGIKYFGGNADLILVDAHYYSAKKINLDFNKALHLNLSSSVKSQEIPSLGEFLQSIIEVVDMLSHTDANEKGYVWSISNKLGIAISKKSLLDFIFSKWGKIIGANKLHAVAVKNIGPSINLTKIGDSVKIGSKFIRISD